MQVANLIMDWVMEWVWIPVLISLIMIVALLSRAVVRTVIAEKRWDRRPIIAVCEVNGKIGVVRWEDYVAAVEAHFEPYRAGKKSYDHGHSMAPHGQRISVNPTFLFTKGCGWLNKHYQRLTGGCYVIRVEFELHRQIAGSDEEVLREAQKYLHRSRSRMREQA